MKKIKVYSIILLIMFMAAGIINMGTVKNVQAKERTAVQYTNNKAKSSKNTLKPQAVIDTAYVMKNGNNNAVKIWGYAVNKSGIKYVKIYIDNKYLGSAKIGQARPDVAAKFKSYPNGSKSGYSAQLNIPASIGVGNKTLKVTFVGKDGTSQSLTRKVTIKADLKPQTVVTTANITKNISGNTLKAWGYAVNKSGVKEIKLYIDNKYLGSAQIGLARKDTVGKFTAYPGGDKCGFAAQLLIPASLGSGNKVLKVMAVGKDGSSNSITKNVTIKQKLIVIDQGHLGYDSGTVQNGYVEAELNNQVAVKLKSELENLGYKVEMTRDAAKPKEYSHMTEKDELRQRCNVANKLKADLFISIHHNSIADAKKQDTVSGIAAYYSTWKPELKDVEADKTKLPSGYDGFADKKPTEAAKFSKKLAEAAQDALAKECEYPKGECVDRNLAVTVHTDMPAVLFELGFICNPTEAARCADPAEQTEKAKVIARVVSTML